MSDFYKTTLHEPRLVIEIPISRRSSEKWNVLITPSACDERKITIKHDDVVIAVYDCVTGEKIE